MNREQVTNGFLNLVHMLNWEQGGAGNERIIDGKVYRYSLKKWKDGYDDMCDKNGGHVKLGVFLDWIDKEFLIADASVDESRAAFKVESERRDAEKAKRERSMYLFSSHRAAFENACEDLYYGYGYAFWLKTHLQEFDNEADAKLVWQAAFNKMSKDER